MDRKGVLCVNAAVAMLMLGCCGRADSNATPVPSGESALLPTASPAAPPTYRRCTGGAWAPTTGRGFAHVRSGVIASATPNHGMQDVFARPGESARITVKASYGAAGKDLEDEGVVLMLDDCQFLRRVASAKTDDDGLAVFEIVAPSEPGAYDLMALIEGDGTTTRAAFHVLPVGTQLVVFDVDGTLTTDDAEVNRDVLDEHFHHIADGRYAAEAYPEGAALAQAWAERGFVIVYLTGRPYWLLDHTRKWLTEGGYPTGVVHATSRHRDVVPSVEGVGEFKAAYLRALNDLGYVTVAAHGNAKTDVWAYAAAGIPLEQTFIIGPHGGEGGTVAVHGDWSRVAELVRQRGRARQPFARP